MGRRRQHRKDDRLPAYVRRHRARDRILYQPYQAGEWGKTLTLRDRAGEPLLADASADEIWQAYARLDVEKAPRTLRWMIERYMETDRFKALASQEECRRYADVILDTPGKRGLFGDVRLTSLRRRHFIQYLERRPPVTGNREIQFVRGAFTWAKEMEYVTESPAHGFRLNKESSRDRYITDNEYERLLGAARSSKSPYLAPAMELAYLLRARVGEVVSLQRKHLRDEGIYLKRKKGSESEITLWSPRLKAAVADAQAHNRDVISPYLLHNKLGRPITTNAVNQAYQKIKKKTKIKGITFHDLKAKGITDHKQHHGGHRSARMEAVYVRLPDAVEPTR